MQKLLFVFGLFLLVPSAVSAQVVINEIAWMGTPVEGVAARQEWRYEWVELHNPTDASVRLDGWKIELYDAEGLDFTIGLYKTVEADGYFVIGASNRIPAVDISYGTLAGKLANAGQRVVLKDAEGNVVEEIDASGGWFVGDNENKLTMERRFPDRQANDKENWGSSLQTGGTLKAANSVAGKEAMVRLESQAFSATTKKSPGGPAFLRVVSSGVFILALLLALGSALSVLLLLRRLVSRR